MYGWLRREDECARCTMAGAADVVVDIAMTSDGYRSCQYRPWRSYWV